MSISIAVPPRFEQDHIIAKIQAQTSSMDAAIARARRQIELLQEYRHGSSPPPSLAGLMFGRRQDVRRYFRAGV